jgi:hypothetical protein
MQQGSGKERFRNWQRMWRFKFGRGNRTFQDSMSSYGKVQK